MSEKFKAKIILTIGISNSGKTTWAKQFIKENPMYVNLNRDDMRIALFCDGDERNYHTYAFSKSKEDCITDVIMAHAKYAISNGQGIIVSDTNLNPKTRNLWKRIAADNDMEYEEVVFDTPLHVCLSRNQKRVITLPKRVLVQQYVSYRKFKGMPEYKGTPGKPEAVVVDIDGTVALMEGRKPYDWSKVCTDKVNPLVSNMVSEWASEDYHIIFVSGRDGSCYDATKAWLDNAGFDYDALYMRQAGNNEPDAIIKERIFWDNVADDYDVVLCIDDRNQMVDQWRAMGLECWQVAEGDF